MTNTNKRTCGPRLWVVEARHKHLAEWFVWSGQYGLTVYFARISAHSSASHYRKCHSTLRFRVRCYVPREEVEK